MNCVGIVLFVLAIVDAVFGKVKLEQGVNQTVTFDGEELEIVADNSKGTDIGYFYICFGSKSDTSDIHCPKGYASYVSGFNADVTKFVLKINRQGKLTEDSKPKAVFGTIIFNADGSLNVLVNKLPVGATVVLPHAKKWAPEKPDKVKQKEEKEVVKSSSTPYILTALCFLFILIVIGFIVYFCVIHKKRHPKPAIPAPPPDDVSCESLEDPYVPTSPIVVPRSKKTTSPKSPVTPAIKVDINGGKHSSKTIKNCQ